MAAGDAVCTGNCVTVETWCVVVVGGKELSAQDPTLGLRASAALQFP